MRKRKSIMLLVILLAMSLITSGCGIALLVGGAGYAMGQGRKGTAQIIEAKAKYNQQYNEYKLGMEKINLEREKEGLEARPIMTFDEWLESQPLSPAELKLFKKYKAQTPKGLEKQTDKK